MTGEEKIVELVTVFNRGEMTADEMRDRAAAIAEELCGGKPEKCEKSGQETEAAPSEAKEEEKAAEAPAKEEKPSQESKKEKKAPTPATPKKGVGCQKCGKVNLPLNDKSLCKKCR